MQPSDPVEELSIPRYEVALSYTDVEIVQSALKMYMTRMEDIAGEEAILTRNDILEAFGHEPEEVNPTIDLRYDFAAQFADAKILFDKLSAIVGCDTTES